MKMMAGRFEALRTNICDGQPTLFKLRFRILCEREEWRRERDSNPRTSFPVTRFPSVRTRPLCDPSKRSGKIVAEVFFFGNKTKKTTLSGGLLVTELLKDFFRLLGSHSVFFEKSAKRSSGDLHAHVSSCFFIQYFFRDQVWQKSSSGRSIGKRALISGTRSFSGQLTSSRHRRN